jgi:hypothetical protein
MSNVAAHRRRRPRRRRRLFGSIGSRRPGRTPRTAPRALAGARAVIARHRDHRSTRNAFGLQHPGDRFKPGRGGYDFPRQRVGPSARCDCCMSFSPELLHSHHYRFPIEAVDGLRRFQPPASRNIGHPPDGGGSKRHDPNRVEPCEALLASPFRPRLGVR